MKIYVIDKNITSEEIKRDLENPLQRIHGELKIRMLKFIKNNPGVDFEKLYEEFFDWSSSTVRSYLTGFMKAEIVEARDHPNDGRKSAYYLVNEDLEDYF